MTRRCEQRLCLRGLDDDAEIHHRDAVGDVFYHSKIMRDEDVRQPKPVLQVAQQVQDLRTDRHVERGYWLVADDQFRLAPGLPGKPPPLASAPPELCRGAGRVSAAPACPCAQCP